MFLWHFLTIIECDLEANHTIAVKRQAITFCAERRYHFINWNRVWLHYIAKYSGWSWIELQNESRNGYASIRWTEHTATINFAFFPLFWRIRHVGLAVDMNYFTAKIPIRLWVPYYMQIRGTCALRKHTFVVEFSAWAQRMETTVRMVGSRITLNWLFGFCAGTAIWMLAIVQCFVWRWLWPIAPAWCLASLNLFSLCSAPNQIRKKRAQWNTLWGDVFVFEEKCLCLRDA